MFTARINWQIPNAVDPTEPLKCVGRFFVFREKPRLDLAKFRQYGASEMMTTRRRVYLVLPSFSLVTVGRPFHRIHLVVAEESALVFFIINSILGRLFQV